MMSTNLRMLNDAPATQSRAQAAKELPNAEPNERAISRPVVVRKGRHLDVDEVLARSLPRVTAKGLNSDQETDLARI